MTSTVAYRASRTPARHIWVAGLVAALVIVAVVVYRGRAGDERVVVVGDSITFMASDEVTNVLDGAYRPEVRAQPGYRIDQMLPDVRAAVESEPHAIVVNLGTNDVLQARERPDWRSGFALMTGLLRDTPCVVLTTINEGVWSFTAMPNVAGDVNREIRDAAATRDNVLVVDWNAMVHGPGGAALLRPDKVHPSEEGQRALARAFRETLRRCP